MDNSLQAQRELCSGARAALPLATRLSFFGELAGFAACEKGNRLFIKQFA